MTKKLTELFNLDVAEDAEDVLDENAEISSDDIQQEIAQQNALINDVNTAIDKIDAALPYVNDLDCSDAELDELSKLAKDKFEDLLDLGMNVEARYSGTILQTAAALLGHAVTAKQAKIDRKLKTIDLQLKKMRLDQANSKSDADRLLDATDGKGQIIDRNELLKQILDK